MQVLKWSESKLQTSYFSPQPQWVKKGINDEDKEKSNSVKNFCSASAVLVVLGGIYPFFKFSVSFGS